MSLRTRVIRLMGFGPKAVIAAATASVLMLSKSSSSFSYPESVDLKLQLAPLELKGIHAGCLIRAANRVHAVVQTTRWSQNSADLRVGAQMIAVAVGVALSMCLWLKCGKPRTYLLRRGERRPTEMSARPRGPVPELCVFDLDACLWDKEMYEMQAVPTESSKVLGDLNGRGEGVVGVMSGRDKISLHRGALIALQEHADGLLPGMRVAVASSADTPFAETVGRTALTMLEVLPGLTIWDLFLRDWDGRDVNQIGRQPPLSSNKAATHFPRLKQATGVRYDKMLFFDDCLWGDHCGNVSAACKEENGRGVVAVRTPHGLGEPEWRQGLKKYADAA